MSKGSDTATSYGLSMGAALAIVLSWAHNGSIVWAILHGFCSWLYVIYFAISFGGL